MPSVTEEIVARPEELAACCKYLATCSEFGFDTEFIGEQTFIPQLCLIQVATWERLFLIDPFTAGPLDEFWNLVVDPSRTGGGNRRYSQLDIERLRRIGSLTASGLNLEGVRHVLELEAEVERLAAELDRVRDEARDRIEQTHRHYRRDLVPLGQALVFRRAGHGDAPRRTGR